MVEITYRGKRTKDGKWIEGFYVKFYDEVDHKENYMIFTINEKEKRSQPYSVYPETVCQYTGLTDKNGRKIFEGDIVKDANDRICAVKWDDFASGFICWDDEILGYKYRRVRTEIIGNIFDNPELIGDQP